MVQKNDESVVEVLRLVLQLEYENLSELRPRNMPEKIVQIIKSVYPDPKSQNKEDN